MSDLFVIGAGQKGEEARAALVMRLETAEVKFPATIKVTNHFVFPVSFPVAGQLYLKASGHEGSSGSFTIKNRSILMQLVADIQAISNLHRAEQGVSIELTKPVARKTAPAKAE